MADNIHKLPPILRVIEGGESGIEASPQVVDDLRKVLALAEAGKVAGFAIITISPLGEPGILLSGACHDPLLAIGTVEALKFQLNKIFEDECVTIDTGGGNGAA